MSRTFMLLLGAALLAAAGAAAAAAAAADPAVAPSETLVGAVVETPLVTFRPVGGAPAEAVAQRCRAILARRGPSLLAAILPADVDPAPVVCHLLPTAAFRARFAGRLPDWGIAVALPGGRVIAIDWQRQGAGGGPRRVEAVFLHELAHALLEQGLAGREAPRWLHEGVATWQSGEWGLADAVALLFEGRPPRLVDLTDRFPAGDAGAGQAYAASALAVQALRRRHGDDIVPRLLSAAAETRDFDAAFLRVTGEPVAAFAAAFDRGRDLPLAWLVRAARWPALWVLLALLATAGFAARRLRNRRRLRAMAEAEARVGSEAGAGAAVDLSGAGEGADIPAESGGAQGSPPPPAAGRPRRRRRRARSSA